MDFERVPEEDRNILIYMLTAPVARRLFGDGWADEARRMLAQFRPTYDLFADDPAFIALVGRLRRDCPEFSHWWETHDVRSAGAGRKLLHHAKAGLLRFEYATFQANDDPALKLAIYTPV